MIILDGQENKFKTFSVWILLLFGAYKANLL
jgi:hypothetical protein